MNKIEEYEIFDLLTRKISGSINRSLLRAFAKEGLNLTTEQWSVMACLWKKDKVTQQSLCSQTHKDKPSMTRLIDNLEKLRMVVRVADPMDRRKKIIHLTEQGLAMKPKTEQVVRHIIELALTDIDSKDIALGRVILQKIMRNLNG